MKTRRPDFSFSRTIALAVSIVLCLLPLGIPSSVAQTQKEPQSRQLVQTAPVTSLPASGSRYALVIGVDQYADTQITTLGGASNDAKSLADALVRYAGFPADQVTILASDQPTERQPTRGNILRRLSNLASVVPRDGLILVSFSGHGMERGGQAFLLPSDAQVSNDVRLLEDTAINVTRLKDGIKDTHVGQVLLILDACRNDPAGRSDSDNPLTTAYTRGFNFDVRNKEVSAFVTLYATALGQRAYEYKEKHQGYFTWDLVEGLKGAAANGKGEVTLAALVKYLQERVPKHVLLDLGAGKDQRPFAVIEGYLADELVIAVAPSARAESAVERTPVTLDNEVVYWDSVKNSSNLQDLKSYLQRFPKGQFAELARRNVQAAVARAVANSARNSNDPVERIIDEGLNRSQVMQTVDYLTNGIGPRLTASPNLKRANEWTRETLSKWGLQNAHLEAWGPFGRGWSLQSFSAEVIDPPSSRARLNAYPKAWSPGTNGPIVGYMIYLDAQNEADLAKFSGKLKGAIVFISPPREVTPVSRTQIDRMSSEDLRKLADAPNPTLPRPTVNPTTEQLAARQQQSAVAQFTQRKTRFLYDEGVALIVDSSRGSDDTVFVQQVTVPQPVSDGSTPARRILPYQKDVPRIIPQITMAAEQYNHLLGDLQRGMRVQLSVNLQVRFQDEDPMGYNTVAEIPGTDLRDEVVMLGAHLDSWHAGTGATDNAAGVAVAMEAVRIIQALGIKPRRTIRIGLWTGEEQGLLGSLAYVAQHFGKLEAVATAPGAATQNKLVTLPEYDKFSAYFNLDNGTGRIRGVYLQGNEAVRPIFREWLSPFRDLEAETLTVANTGGTDHLGFDRIGLPGFQFIQDSIQYDTLTHHSNRDVFENLQSDDLKEAASIMATFVYRTAMSDYQLPRKPLPR